MESIEEVLCVAPTSLDATDTEVIKVGEYFLPFMTGFEIECFQGDNFDVEEFKAIPDILDVKVDTNEQRFRIPNGIKGLQCLFNITLVLKENSLLNTGSGIHYHVDCTEMFDDISQEAVNFLKEKVLMELDKWDYKGTYNDRNMAFGRCWVRVHRGCKTLEIRIGEMTFDYRLLYKRIVDCNRIVRDFKENLRIYNIKDKTILYDTANIEEVIQNRTIRI